MTDRIRTLLLEANGTHWAAVALDTVGQGLFTARDNAPRFITSSPILRKLFADRYADASYMADWREAFCASDQLAVTVCNITNLLEFRAHRRTIETYDLIVVLHSAAGDRMGILNRRAHWFHERRGKLAVFVGNEYDLMDEKISFINESGADYVCTQLPIDVARSLYATCTATVLPMPHALNPRVYNVVPGQARTVDVGFVGDLYDRLIGDQERTRIVEFIARDGASHGLRCDVRRQRMPRAEWARYLNSCHGVVGAESGTYFLQRNGQALRCAKAAIKQKPDASFDEVFERCFAHTAPVLNGKAISSRHFEPIGTRTCQLLVAGTYNGILEPDRHYIAVDRDLSNIEDAVRRFKDVACRARITSLAYEHAIERHTYDRRIADFVDAVRAGARPAVLNN
jgi:hypothetical protein